ncbi:MAG: insulinase family protein [Nitrospirae bacterium]|nr:insulinase family protein [Nitrospirota bacterium]
MLLLPAAAAAAPPFSATLENGLTVYILEEPKAPVATIQVWYHVGGRNELSGRTGLAHLLEHMMFKGTTNHGKGEYSRLIAKNGGTENAFTANDETVYFSNLASDRTELGLELEADRMANLLLDPKEAMLERDVVKEERRMRTDDDPQSLLVETGYALAFLAHPYGRPVIGWMEDISRLTRDDMAAFYHRYYTPNNATLVVVGDVSAKRLMPVIQRTFGSIPSRPVAFDPITPEQPQLGERRFVLKREAQLPVVFMGYHVPNYSGADAAALEVLGTILSSGKSSRLYRNLVYQQRVALSADGGYDPLSIDPDLFYFYGMAQPGHTHEELEASLDQEIAKLQNELVGDRELQKAKNGLLAGYIFGQDSNFFRAMQIGRTVNVGAGVGYIDSYVPRIQAVTREAVRRAAQQYLVKDHRTVGYLVPLPPSSTPGTPAP